MIKQCKKKNMERGSFLKSLFIAFATPKVLFGVKDESQIIGNEDAEFMKSTKRLIQRKGERGKTYIIFIGDNRNQGIGR